MNHQTKSTAVIINRALIRKTPDGNIHNWNDWYYCQYHKYDDPLYKRPSFKVWVTYKPTGNHYWEWFYYWKSPTR